MEAIQSPLDASGRLSGSGDNLVPKPTSVPVAQDVPRVRKTNPALFVNAAPVLLNQSLLSNLPGQSEKNYVSRKRVSVGKSQDRSEDTKFKEKMTLFAERHRPSVGGIAFGN